jgi:hypothetical protein
VHAGWRISAVFRLRFLSRAQAAADDEAVASSAGGLAPLMTSQSVAELIAMYVGQSL